MTYEASLSKAERTCFGYDGEDRKSWIRHLARRLSLRKAEQPSEAKNRRNSLAPRRTMVLDKTVFSTACRIAAGRIDARLFRMRAELVDGGRYLALDLYQADTSKQCRILLTEDDLVAVGLQSSATNALVENSEPGYKITSMLVGPSRRETAIRQLTRQLQFVPDSDSVVLSVGGDSRVTAMVTTIASEQRRPHCSLKVAFLQAAGKLGSRTVGHDGLVEAFLKHRHQPRVLRHGNEAARTRFSVKNVGKKSMHSSTPSRCDLRNPNVGRKTVNIARVQDRVWICIYP